MPNCAHPIRQPETSKRHCSPCLLWVISGPNALALTTSAISHKRTLSPEYSRAYSDRGNALLVLGQCDQALEDYCQAIRLNPDHAPTVGRRGALYERLGFVDQALADYRTMNGLGARPAWLEDKLGEYGLLE